MCACYLVFGEESPVCFDDPGQLCMSRDGPGGFALKWFLLNGRRAERRSYKIIINGPVAQLVRAHA